IRPPDGVTVSFQVSLNKIDPAVSNRCINLFAKDDWRAALADETVEGGPEVAVVGRAFAASSGREGLAGAGTGPDGSVVGPAGKAQGEGPAADAGEEMALGKSAQVIRGDISNVTFVHLSWGNVPVFDQLPEPRRREGVELVVVGAHAVTPVIESVPAVRATSIPPP